MAQETQQADVSISNEGTIIMFAVNTPAARLFVEENVPLESWQWMGNAFAVEPRYADDLIEGMQAGGLVVE